MTEALVLRQSQSKSAWVVVGSIAFVAMGIWMISSPDFSSRHSPEMVAFMGWVCVLLASFTGVAAVWSWVKPTELILSPDGFQVHGFRRKPVTPWRGVRRFFIAEIKKTKLVCYELDRTPTNLQRAMGADKPGAWGDGWIPVHLEQTPDQVLTVLEAWRARYGA